MTKADPEAVPLGTVNVVPVGIVVPVGVKLPDDPVTQATEEELVLMQSLYVKDVT